MRIVASEPGQSLELRGDADRGYRRERWGGVTLAMGIPLLLPHAFPLIDPEYIFPAQFTSIWIWLFGGTVLLELWDAITDRDLIGIRFDRGRNEFSIQTRSTLGRVRTWTNELRDVTVSSIVVILDDDHRTNLTLELGVEESATIPSTASVGALDLGILIFSVLLLPFRLLGLFLGRSDEKGTRNLNLEYDGGDPAAVRALAAEIGAITGNTPSIDFDSWASEEEKDEPAKPPRTEADVPPLHSPFANTRQDLHERGVTPIATESPGEAAQVDSKGVRLGARQILLHGDFDLVGGAWLSLACSFALIGTAILRGGLLEAGSVSMKTAIFLSLGCVLLVRGVGSFLHLHGGRVRVDADAQQIRGGFLGGARTDFGEVEQILDVTTEEDEAHLVVVTSGGSFALPVSDETPPEQRATLAGELARRIGVKAGSVRLPRAVGSKATEASKPESEPGLE